MMVDFEFVYIIVDGIEYVCVGVVVGMDID